MSTFVDLFLSTFEERRERTALLDDHGSTSYRELAERAAGIAQGLRGMGLEPGDRFTLTLPNGIDFVACALATLWSGTVIVPVNDALPAADREYILEVVRPSAHLGSTDDIPVGPREVPVARELAHHAACVFFTSGTTSRPKGVQHHISSMLENVAVFNRHAGIDESVRMLHVLPMGYMAGFLNTVLSPLIAGGTVVLAPPFDARSATTFWKPAMEHGANAMWITPTIAAFLVRLNRGTEVPDWTRQNLRHAFVGTAPLPGTTATSFTETFGIPCLQSYGMTEVLLSSAPRVDDPAPETVGHPLPGVELSFLDAEGRPAGGGEIYLRTPSALDGYLDLETGLASPALTDGWMPTGDTGHLDDHGRLVITGRSKDLIIHGGANVSPPAVEDVLLAHPAIVDAGVTGRDHPFWGEEVVAHVVAEGDAPDASELGDWCRQRLAPDAVPTSFRFREELPRGSTGKLQRHLLREEGP